MTASSPEAMTAPPPPRRRRRSKAPTWNAEFPIEAAAYAEARNLTMSHGLYELLHEAISSGAIPEGAELRERDLAALHKVSRTPAREALRRLLAEQLLVRRGKSLVVATRSLKEVEDGLSLRGAIMPLIVRMAIERASSEDIEQLARDTAQLRIATDAGDLPQIVELSKAFDRDLFAMAHSPMVSRALTVQFGPSGVIDRMLALPGRAQRATEDRELILAAIRSRNKTAAVAAVRRHVQSATADLLRETGKITSGA